MTKESMEGQGAFLMHVTREVTGGEVAKADERGRGCVQERDKTRG